MVHPQSTEGVEIRTTDLGCEIGICALLARVTIMRSQSSHHQTGVRRNEEELLTTWPEVPVSWVIRSKVYN